MCNINFNNGFFSALISYKLRRPDAGREMHSLTSAFCKIRLDSGEEAQDHEDRMVLLSESLAHKVLAYSQVHVLFRFVTTVVPIQAIPFFILNFKSVQSMASVRT
jgi:hypothetical protein